MKILLNNGTVTECTDKAEELHIIRHSAAHIMAQAISRLYPHAIFAYGPATEKGFYYDVDLGDTKLTDADLGAIEKEMKKITKENLPIKVKASMPDSMTIVLNFIQFPENEADLFYEIINFIGESELGINKILLEN